MGCVQAAGDGFPAAANTDTTSGEPWARDFCCMDMLVPLQAAR